MNELLFFVLGFIIGGLSGLTTMCCIAVNNNYKTEIKVEELKKDNICEKEQEK